MPAVFSRVRIGVSSPFPASDFLIFSDPIPPTQITHHTHTMLKVIEVAFTGYSVTNLKKSREFYETVLNLTPGMVFEHENSAWIEYEIGPHTVAITNMSGDWKPNKNGGGVALEVEDFDTAIAWLEKNQVTFYSPPFESPVCHMALIADPDGNSICIHKRKPAVS